MASKKIGDIFVEIRAEQEKLKKDLADVKKKMQSEGKKAGKTFGSGFGSALSKAFIAGGGLLALTKLTSFVKESIALAGKQELAEKKVAQAIKSTGGVAGFTAEQLKKVASELQRTSAYGDEDILDKVTAQLLTFTNITQNEFLRTQRVAMDLSTVLGSDLQSSSIMLGKALNDPVANLSALSRAGIQFTESQKEMVKQLVKSNKLHEAQSLILDELERQYGGQSQAVLETYAGRIQAISNAWGDFKETVGQLVIPIIEEVTEGFKVAGEWLGIFQAGWKSISTESVIQEMKEMGAPLKDIRKLQQDYLKEIETEIQKRQLLDSKTINKERISTLILTTQEAINESLREELRIKQLIVGTSDEDKKKSLGKQLGIQENQTAQYRKQIVDYKEIIQLLEKGKSLQNEINGIVVKQPAPKKVDILGRTKGRAEEGYSGKRDTTIDYQTNQVFQDMINQSGIRGRGSEGYGKSKGLPYEQQQLVKEAINETRASVEAQNLELSKTPDIMGNIQEASNVAMGNLISGWSRGIVLFKQANSMLQQTINMLAQIALQEVATGLLSLLPGGSLLGFLGIGGKASGGYVASNTPYVVGERGRELFVPNTSGYIIPNNQLTTGRDSNIGTDQLGKKLEAQNMNLVSSLNTLIGVTVNKKLNTKLKNDSIVVSYERGSKQRNRLR